MNEAGQGGWLDDLLRTLAERRRRPAKRRTVRLELERLEDRLAPASTINILHASFGAGSLDNTLAMNHGVISASDGGNTPGTLSEDELAEVGSFFGLNITAQNSIVFNDLNGSLDLGSNPVAFHANQGDITFANPSNTLIVDSGSEDGPPGGSFFFQASGSLDLGNLDAASYETINLQAGGALTAQSLTAVGGFISIQAGGPVALNGAVDAGNGYYYGGYVTLSADGPVTQAAPIQAMQLMLDGSGSFALTNAGNAVDVLADSAVSDGYTGGAVLFVDSTALTLGVPGDTNTGIATTDAPISIVAGGSLYVEFDVSAGAAPVDLTVAAAGQSLVNGAAISGDAVALTADAMSLSGGTINAGGGPVALQTLTPSLGIDVGVASSGEGTGSSGGGTSSPSQSQADLAFSQADLDTIAAGVLSIGGPGFAGDITISGLVSDSSAGWNTLALLTGADINETAGAGYLEVQNLALVAGTGIGDDGGLLTSTTNLAFDNASGVVDIENTGALTLTDVDGLASSSNGGPTTLSAAGPITFEADIASAGMLSVTAAGPITFEAEVTSDGPLTVATAGPVTFEADITSAGTLTVATAESSASDSPEEDITVLSGVTLESTGGDVVLQAADSIVLETDSLVKSDTGAVYLDVSVNDPDNDGVFDLQGSIVAPQGVFESPTPDDLALSLGGLATPGGLPTILNGAFADTATDEAHTVLISWGDNSPDTMLTLAAGEDTFSSSHVYASEGNFTATVLVADSSGGTTSGNIIVPVLPASYGSVVAVDAQPGQTVSVTVSDPTTGDSTTITLVRAAGAGGGGELLAANLLNPILPPAPLGTVQILAAFDFREFNLNPGDRAFITVSFAADVPPDTFPIVEYVDPDTGMLETFNPSNPPGYLTITVSPGRVTATIVLDNTTIPKLIELTGTEFTVSAAVPSTPVTAVVSQSLASADVGETAPGRTASFQSTSQLTFGLATLQTAEAGANLLALDTDSSGGNDVAPADAAGTAAARAAWAQFVADEFPNDPQAVWEYGGDDALRLWLANHPHAPSKSAPWRRPPPLPLLPWENRPPGKRKRASRRSSSFSSKRWKSGTGRLRPGDRPRPTRRTSTGRR